MDRRAPSSDMAQQMAAGLPVGIIRGRVAVREFEFDVVGPLRRADYLQVRHPADGWTLAQAASMEKFAEEGEERTRARAVVIGVKDEAGVLRLPRTPLSPGDRVFPADPELVRRVLGLGEPTGAYLGHLEGTTIPVYIPVNTLVTRHLSVLAKTGGGKSYATAVLVEELLERKVPVVVLDPHGEYGSLKEPSDDPRNMEAFGVAPSSYAPQVSLFTPMSRAIHKEADRVFRLDGINLKSRDLWRLLPDLAPRLQSTLQQAVQKAAARRETYRITDILHALEEAKGKDRYELQARLEELRDSGILSDSPTTVDELVVPGRGTIINLKGLDPRLQEVVAARVAHDLFEARKHDRVPPLMLVVEEAHEFCPEKGFKKAASSDILRTIASEGRKFGLGLGVISQRPARIDKNVLSQCGSQIILRVTNPNDIMVLRKSLEGFTEEMAEDLKRLPPGTAIVATPDIEKPVTVRIRPRRTRHGGTAKVVG